MDIEPVTEGELSILEVIWAQGSPTSRDIAAVLYEKVSDSKMASVQKLLERLEDAQCVTRDRSGAAHTFRASVGRDEVIGRRLRDVAEKLCGGSLTPLLTHLVRTKQLSARERQELRALIDELDHKGKGKADAR